MIAIFALHCEFPVRAPVLANLTLLHVLLVSVDEFGVNLTPKQAVNINCNLLIGYLQESQELD